MDTVRDAYSNSMPDKVQVYGTSNKLSPNSLKTTSRNDYEGDSNSKLQLSNNTASANQVAREERDEKCAENVEEIQQPKTTLNNQEHSALLITHDYRNYFKPGASFRKEGDTKLTEQR